ncbi:MAG: response regulator [Armatimonadetes bacterium]|nr:response regulator [Armatimonadota bacterium]
MVKNNILIIESNADISSVLSDILKDFDCQIIVLNKEKDALKRIQEKNFDVIILDSELSSNFNNLKLIENIKELHPETIIITMNKTEFNCFSAHAENLEKGADVYINKPINKDEVKFTLKKALKEAKLFKENRKLIDELQQMNKSLEDINKELKKSSQIKSQFLANMSHELRTPLNSILGFTEILVDEFYGNINQKQREFLQYILQSSENLLQLINDILDLSKIEVGKIELEYSEFSLKEFMDNIYKIVFPLTEKKKIKLEIIIPEGLLKIWADINRIRQVLLNLINNAIKFTPNEGNIKIFIKEYEENFEFIVEDNGIGIKPYDLQIIFEEFRQLDSSSSKEYEGTGLGLAIAKKFIEMHHGAIHAESEYGKWTKFIFTLPKTIDDRLYVI